MSKFVCRIGLLTLVLLGTGCTSYYRVTEVASGKAYYTTNWNAGRYGYSGAARFRDARTGADVTLQSSEVESLSKYDFTKAVPNPK